MTDETYCNECGCEIRSLWDIGYRSTEPDTFYSFSTGDTWEVEREFIVCRSCMEAEERAWEEFKQTPEYQYECAFQRWCEQQTTNGGILA